MNILKINKHICKVCQTELLAKYKDFTLTPDGCSDPDGLGFYYKKGKMSNINGYNLSRAWFDFAFENQGKVSGNHCAMIMWFIELNNRMGWKSEFGAPREQTMAAVGISSYNTYKKVFNDLAEWGFIKIVKESKNQWTANIIALSKNDKAVYKALDKALILASESHEYQHCTSTDTGTVAIDKQVNKETSKQVNNNVVVEAAEKIIEEQKINEEDFQEKLNHLNCNLLKQQIIEKNKIDEKNLEVLFREFYIQKIGFDELKGKDNADLIKNFYYWVPKNLKAEKEKSSAKKESFNNQQPARGVEAALKFANVKMRD